MKPVNSTFIQSMVAIMAIFMSVQLTYSQSCITCDNNNIKAGFGNAVNSAYSNQSILGNGNTTGRNNAVAIGTASQANWSHSYVFGSSSVTNGMHAYAIGSNAVAQSTSSFAIGNYAKSMFGNAHSIGNFTTSNQVGAYVFGLGISDVYPLINTTTNSLVVGFKSQYPTLFVSETASGDQSGRVGIGNVTDPQAKLHIRADDGEDASLLLEPTGVGTFGILKFADNAHSIKAKAGQNFIFSAPEGKSFVFENGRMGVGTADPQARLHVSGDFQVGSLSSPQNIRMNGSINSEAIQAFAFGEGSSASGNYSFVAGRNSFATNAYTYVLGSYSKAQGLSSVTIGNQSISTGNYSFVFGNNSVSEFDFSMALGHNLNANMGGFVLGQGRVDAVLTNNQQGTLMIGFNSQYPTLFVGRTDINNQSGRVGIGNVTDPQAKLHIRADAGEEASLLLEAGSSNHEANIRLGQNHKISATEAGNLNFETADNKHFVFHQGDIYLDDIQSGIIMKSPNGQCWRGTLNDEGMLNFSQTTCPDGTLTTQQSPTMNNMMEVYPNPATGNITVEYELDGRTALLQLSGQDGKVVLRQTVQSNKTELSLARFTKGIYLLSLMQEGRTMSTARVVKE